MSKKLILILLALAMVFALAACNDSSSDSDGAPNAPGGSNSSGGGGANNQGGGNAASANPVEITVAFDSLPNGLCPISEDIIANMCISNDLYDRLLYVDANMNWNPAIASSWTQVDPLTWEFEINLNHVFQNGDPLTMEDVLFSITRLGDIAKSADVAAMLESVTIDGNILRIKTTEVNNTIVSRLNGQAIIVNKAYIEAGGDEAVFMNPIGTGPYRVTAFTPGTTVVLETWDGYPFEQPQINKITYLPIPENANRYIAVETGQMQYGSVVTGLEAELARSNPDVELLEVNGLSLVCLSFNNERAPFDNVNVRRAISHAIDRESICALSGGRPPVTSILFMGYEGLETNNHPNFPQFDLDRARDLLAGEGFDASNPLRFELTYFRPDPGIEVIQSSLRQIGVEVTLNLVEFSVYLQLEGAGEFEVIWTTQTNRASSSLMDLDRVDVNLIGSRNISRFYNPRAQEIVERMRVTTDQQEINALNNEIQTIIADLVPMPAIFRMPFYSVMSPGLEGVVFRGDRQQIFRFATYNP